MKKEAKYTLLTNLRFIQYKELRLHCNGLLLTESSNGSIFDGPEFTLRGFGTEGAWSVFQRSFEKAEDIQYTLVPVDSSGTVVMIGGDGKEKPLFHGYNITFGDGTELVLQTETAGKPLDVFVVEQNNIELIWKALWRKSAEYWQAPYMPRLTYGPPNPDGFNTY